MDYAAKSRLSPSIARSDPANGGRDMSLAGVFGEAIAFRQNVESTVESDCFKLSTEQFD